MGRAGVKVSVILKLLPSREEENCRKSGMNSPGVNQARDRKPKHASWPWGASEGARGRQEVVRIRIPSNADHATIEGTQHPGNTEEMGREDFLEEVTFELSHVMRVRFSRRWRQIWLKAIFATWQLSDNLFYPLPCPFFPHLP